MDVHIFEETESKARSYCRNIPFVFERAEGALLYAENGDRYIDFFAGAGALNYGHNPEPIRHALSAYLESRSLSHGLDMFTTAKRTFLQAFKDEVLTPGGYDYRVMFPGPTGTNAVEAALKLGRKAKNRSGIFSFMGAFHGMTMGSLAVTGRKYHRESWDYALPNVTFMPYHGFMKSLDTLDYMEAVLADDCSGINKPAAVICETVQAEGGVIVAPTDWLRRLYQLCRRHDILFIVDDIQVGCGRTGPFFSFERAGIKPDMVTLSKSISGYGLPMSLLLIRDDLDIWGPGEHNGTFRGNQMAFVGATSALRLRRELNLETRVRELETLLGTWLEKEIKSIDERLAIRGLGLIWGINCSGLGNDPVAGKVAEDCIRDGLVIERSGRRDQVLKIMPPLTIEPELLMEGCQIIVRAFERILAHAH